MFVRMVLKEFLDVFEGLRDLSERVEREVKPKKLKRVTLNVLSEHGYSLYRNPLQWLVERNIIQFEFSRMIEFHIVAYNGKRSVRFSVTSSGSVNFVPGFEDERLYSALSNRLNKVT